MMTTEPAPLPYPIDPAWPASLRWAVEFLPHFFTDEPSAFHIELMRDLENGDHRLIGRVGPRGHAKSTCAALAFPLWCICEQRRRNIVILTHENALATQFVRDIRTELETNDRLRAAYGDLCPTANAELRMQNEEGPPPRAIRTPTARERVRDCKKTPNQSRERKRTMAGAAPGKRRAKPARKPRTSTSIAGCHADGLCVGMCPDDAIRSPTASHRFTVAGEGSNTLQPEGLLESSRGQSKRSERRPRKRPAPQSLDPEGVAESPRKDAGLESRSSRDVTPRKSSRRPISQPNPDSAPADLPQSKIENPKSKIVSRPRWREALFTTSTGITVQAKSTGASLRGVRVGPLRPDLIICDDLEKDEHVESPERRRKLEQWLRRVVLPALSPDGRLLVVGSLIHYDSLLSNLRDRRRFPRWDYKVYRALEAVPIRDQNPDRKGAGNQSRERQRTIGSAAPTVGRGTDVNDAINSQPEGLAESSRGQSAAPPPDKTRLLPSPDPEGVGDSHEQPNRPSNGGAPLPNPKSKIENQEWHHVALWPARWPVERLHEERQRIGTLAFEQEYQASPIDETARIFRPDWLHRYDPAELAGRRLTNFLAIDPATGADDGDFFALFAGSVDPSSGVIYTRELTLERIGIVDQVQRIVAAFERWKPLRIGIEATAYQIALKQILEEVSRKRGLYMPLVPIPATANKRARIVGASPFFENGMFRLPPLLDPDVEAQFLHFPRAAHDDAPDVCAMAIELARALPRCGPLEFQVLRHPDHDRRSGW